MAEWTPQVGDIVRIGKGLHDWKVTGRYVWHDEEQRASLIRHNASAHVRNQNNDVPASRLVLVMAASAEEVERAAREQAERTARTEHLNRVRYAVQRATQVLDHSWVADDTGVMIEARDLRALLAEVNRWGMS